MAVLWTSTSPTASWKRPVGRVGVNAGATFTTQHKLRASAGSTTPSGVLFGASPGGDGQVKITTITTVLGPAIFRTYDSGVSGTFGSNTQGQYVPVGFPQHSSIKPNCPTLALGSGTTYNTAVQACIAEATGIPDTPGQRRSVWHEPYDEVFTKGTFTGAQWSAMQVNYKNDVLGPVNATRSNPILLNLCMQGFVLGSSFAANLATIFTPAALAAGDEVGFDCYQPGQQDLAASYAASKGKNWSIPEYGWLAGGTSSQADDATALSFMQANVPRLSTYSNPPTNVCWFNGNATQITGLATHAAADYWQSIT